MGLGYDRPLYLLALDHRIPPHHDVFGVAGDPTPADSATVTDAKAVIAEGFAHALAAGVAPDEGGILVDERWGAEIARTALAAGWICAMPAERSGQPAFELEYGDDFARHVDAFDPTFVKALVRYNPDGSISDNRRSIDGLGRLSGWLREHDRKLLCELIVPAEPAQLASVAGAHDRYETEIRPALMRTAIAELQDAGIEPDVWKLEGTDRRADCETIAAQARAGGRDRIGCVVLGRGADPGTVDDWLRAGAGVAGYLGFAIGRTLWADAIGRYLDGSIPRAEAARRISESYRHAIDVFRGS